MKKIVYSILFSAFSLFVQAQISAPILTGGGGKGNTIIADSVVYHQNITNNNDTIWEINPAGNIAQQDTGNTVTIGTTNALAPLTVWSQNAAFLARFRTVAGTTGGIAVEHPTKPFYSLFDTSGNEFGRLYFDDDTLRMESPTGNPIKIGSNSLVIDSASVWTMDKVGIGTATPEGRLIVKDEDWQILFNNGVFSTGDTSDVRVISIGDSTITLKNDNFGIHSWFQANCLDSTNIYIEVGQEAFDGTHYAETHYNTNLATDIGTITQHCDSLITLGISLFKNVIFVKNGSNEGSIRFVEAAANGSNRINLTVPASITTNRTITLPSDAPGAGKVVQTDASGNWSYATPSSDIWQEVNDSTISWINNTGDTAILLNDPANGLVLFNGLYNARFAMLDGQLFKFGNGLVQPRIQIVGTFQSLIVETNLTLPYETSNVTNPPTDAELDALFGTPATVGDGFTGKVKDSNSNNFYEVVAVGSGWYTFTATLAP